jgi:hypothetical protein
MNNDPKFLNFGWLIKVHPPGKPFEVVIPQSEAESRRIFAPLNHLIEQGKDSIMEQLLRARGRKYTGKARSAKVIGTFEEKQVILDLWFDIKRGYAVISPFLILCDPGQEETVFQRLDKIWDRCTDLNIDPFDGPYAPNEQKN